MSTYLTALGDQLRRAREAQSMTVAEVAWRCGLPSRYVKQAESGRGGDALRTVWRIAVALGVHLSMLVTGAEDDGLARGAATWFVTPTVRFQPVERHRE